MGKVETHFDLKRHMPLRPYSIPLVIWDVVENTWSEKGVKFTEAYPKEDAIDGPTIVWKIYRRVGGVDGLETLKPRAREYRKNANDPYMAEDVWGQWQTIIYQFDILAPDNQTSNDMVEELDDMLFHITPILKNLGVKEWLFDEQLIDVEAQVGTNFMPGKSVTQEIYRRSLRYRCILDRKFYKTIPTIQSIWITAMVQNEDILNERVIRTPGSASDTLSNTWVIRVGGLFSTALSPLTTDYEYVAGVDYNLKVDLKTGVSTIEWIAEGKYPAAGSIYYVTYTYGIEETAGDVKIPE